MEQLWSLMPIFLEGFGVTLLLLAVSGVLSLVLGTLIAAMRISPVGALRTFAASSAVPTSDVNTRPCSCHRSPAAARCHP